MTTNEMITLLHSALSVDEMLEAFRSVVPADEDAIYDLDDVIWGLLEHDLEGQENWLIVFSGLLCKV